MSKGESPVDLLTTQKIIDDGSDGKHSYVAIPRWMGNELKIGGIAAKPVEVLSTAERMMLIMLRFELYDKHSAWFRIEPTKLARRVGVHRSHVYRMTHRLIDLGFLLFDSKTNMYAIKSPLLSHDETIASHDATLSHGETPPSHDETVRFPSDKLSSHDETVLSPCETHKRKNNKNIKEDKKVLAPKPVKSVTSEEKHDKIIAMRTRYDDDIAAMLEMERGIASCREGGIIGFGPLFNLYTYLKNYPVEVVVKSVARYNDRYHGEKNEKYLKGIVRGVDKELKTGVSSVKPEKKKHVVSEDRLKKITMLYTKKDGDKYVRMPGEEAMKKAVTKWGWTEEEFKAVINAFVTKYGNKESAMKVIDLDISKINQEMSNE